MKYFHLQFTTPEFHMHIDCMTKGLWTPGHHTHMYMLNILFQPWSRLFLCYKKEIVPLPRRLFTRLWNVSVGIGAHSATRTLVWGWALMWGEEVWSTVSIPVNPKGVQWGLGCVLKFFHNAPWQPIFFLDLALCNGPLSWWNRFWAGSLILMLQHTETVETTLGQHFGEGSHILAT